MYKITSRLHSTNLCFHGSYFVFSYRIKYPVKTGIVSKQFMSASIVTSSAHTPSGQGTLRQTASPLQEGISHGPTASNMEGISGFVNKPARGWLHPDHLFAKDGINYNVRVSNVIL